MHELKKTENSRLEKKVVTKSGPSVAKKPVVKKETSISVSKSVNVKVPSVNKALVKETKDELASNPDTELAPIKTKLTKSKPALKAVIKKEIVEPIEIVETVPEALKKEKKEKAKKKDKEKKSKKKREKEKKKKTKKKLKAKKAKKKASDKKKKAKKK